MGSAATPAASPTVRSRGLVSPWRSSPRMIAVVRMMASLANSDGSIWKPPGSEIQEWAPLTMLPSGVSTTARPRADTA